MFGSIANGRTEIHGCLMGDDVKATMGAFRAMGVTIEETGDARVVIDGRGSAALHAPAGPLDLGNSGTSIRLLAGLLAGTGFAVELLGDASLCRRPMRRVTEPLGLMGALIEPSAAGTPPLRISPVSGLRAIRYELPMASAQVKSAILLAGLSADGDTCVVEPAPSRDHTERMLGAFGVTVRRNDAEVCIAGGQRLSGTTIVVPGDISSAAFFLVGAAMTEGAELESQNVGVNPTRTGIIEILRHMGAEISLVHPRSAGAEPVADVRIRGRRLRGIDIPTDLVTSAIDEFPAIFVAAACADGVTRLREADELRHKESDRIEAMADGLKTLGVGVTTYGDGIEIAGRAGRYGGGRIDSRGDHRVAMAFAIAALNADNPIEIDDCAAIATSFPGFTKLARRAGLGVTES